MPVVQEVIDLIEKFAPPETCEKWDNSGWQVNLGKKDFNKILTAVTVTQKVVNQALNLGCDLILAHHPFIFEPLKIINSEEIITAVQNGIQIYSAHTNLDIAKGGTTDTLAEKCGFAGNLTVKGFINYKKLDREFSIDVLQTDIKKRLGIDVLKVINPSNKKRINSVAFCAGAGGSEISAAENLQIDLFITGEVKFHEAAEAKNTVIFEVGHYDSEKFAGEIFKKILGDKYEIIEADETEPYYFC